MEIEPGWQAHVPPNYRPQGIEEYCNLLETLCEDAIEDLEPATGEVNYSYDHLAGIVNTWLWTSHVASAGSPGAFVGTLILRRMVKQDMEKIRELADRLIDEITKFREHHEPIVSLIATSRSWNSLVKGPLGDVSARLFNRNLSDDHVVGLTWHDHIREEYESQCDRQEKALDRLVTRARVASEWLSGVASANIQLIVDVIEKAGEFAAIVTRMASEAMAGVTLPWAVSTAAELTGKVVNEAFDLLGAVLQEMDDARVSAAVLDTERQERGGLTREGKWPRSVVRV